MAGFKVNFQKRTLGFSDLFSAWVFLALILIGIAVLAGTTFGDFSALASVSNKISALEDQRDALTLKVEKDYGGSVAALLTPVKSRMHAGFLKYFYFLSTIQIPSLWLNRVEINLDTMRVSITGEALNASSLQLYYTKLKGKGPLRNINLRISKFSSVKELTNAEKAKLRTLATQGKRAEILINTKATSSFEVTNEPPPKKKKR